MTMDRFNIKHIEIEHDDSNCIALEILFVLNTIGI